jgi:hypothetical protein
VVAEAHRSQQIVEPLGHQSRADTQIPHRGCHLVKDVWLAHVIAVHHHQDVLHGNVRRLGGARVYFVENDVVQICRLAIELAWHTHSVPNIEDVGVACNHLPLRTLTRLNIPVYSGVNYDHSQPSKQLGFLRIQKRHATGMTASGLSFPHVNYFMP